MSNGKHHHSINSTTSSSSVAAASASSPSSSEKIEWSRTTILDFIDDYRGQRVLWDPNTKGYHIKQTKYEALKMLGHKYSAEIRSIRSKIKSLRSSFHREHGKVINGRRQGVHYQPMWFAYDAIRFILDGELTTQQRSTRALKATADADAAAMLGDDAEAEEGEEEDEAGADVEIDVKEEADLKEKRSINGYDSGSDCFNNNNNNNNNNSFESDIGEEEYLRAMGLHKVVTVLGAAARAIAKADEDVKTDIPKTKPNITATTTATAEAAATFVTSTTTAANTRAATRASIATPTTAQSLTAVNMASTSTSPLATTAMLMTNTLNACGAENEINSSTAVAAAAAAAANKTSVENYIAARVAAALAVPEAYQLPTTNTISRNGDEFAAVTRSDYEVDSLQNYCNISADDVKTEIIESDTLDLSMVGRTPLALTMTPPSVSSMLNYYKHSNERSQRKRKLFPQQTNGRLNSTSGDGATAAQTNENEDERPTASKQQKQQQQHSIERDSSSTLTNSSRTVANSCSNSSAMTANHLSTHATNNNNNSKCNSSGSNSNSNSSTDEYGVFGEYVAITIRKLKTSKAKIVIKHLINNLLYEAELGKYDHGIPSSKEPPQLYKM